MELCFQRVVVKQLVDLNADFGVFVAEERRDAAFGGTKCIFAETLFFIFVE